MTRIPSCLTSSAAQADEVHANTLIVGNEVSTGMATSLHTDVPSDHIIQKGYLEQQISPIRKLLNQVAPSYDYIKGNHIITPSLCNEFFLVPDDWLMDRWEIRLQSMYCLGGYESNHLILSRNLYIGEGYYYIKLHIEKMDSGHIEIYKNDKWLATIRETGVYYLEVLIEDVESDEIAIRGIDVNAHEEIAIKELAFYYVTARFYHYLIQKIKDLSVVDATNYIPREEFIHELNKYVSQFTAVGDKFTDNLNKHIEQPNPHKTKPSDIGASPVGHKHSEYSTPTDIALYVTERLRNYSQIGHTHPEYVQTENVEKVIGSSLQAHLEKLVGVSPMTVTYGPEGILPGRFSTVGISAPSTIFWNSRVNHSSNTFYDYNNGNISVDHEELLSTGYKFFDYQSDGVEISKELSLPIAIRLDLHYSRKISGYRVRVNGATIDQWYMYSGNTTFLHRVTNQEYFTEEDEAKVYNLTLNEIEECPSITFVIENLTFDDNTDICNIKIDIDYTEFTNSQFGITPEEFAVCLPTQGINRIVIKEKTNKPIIIEPEIAVKDTPLYIFMGQELGASKQEFYTSYYRPLYSNRKEGIDHFAGKFDNIPRDTSVIESYTHPAFGKLEMAVGISEESYPLKNIYSNDIQGWRSVSDSTTVTIVQTIDSDNVMLDGYLLSWRKNENEEIPESWTLTVEGYDQYGDYKTDIVDSVDKFYPFYSVEDDDIVYYQKCPSIVTIKKIILTMNTTKSDPHISLNKLRLFLTERYYSIAENKMYLGHNTVSQMCLGRAYYLGEDKGWEINPICFGASTTIPVNNLGNVDTLMEYVVDNPFFTENVVVTTHEYQTQKNSSISQIYITDVDAEKIKIGTSGFGIHSVTISRSW